MEQDPYKRGLAGRILQALFNDGYVPEDLPPHSNYEHGMVDAIRDALNAVDTEAGPEGEAIDELLATVTPMPDSAVRTLVDYARQRWAEGTRAGNIVLRLCEELERKRVTWTEGNDAVRAMVKIEVCGDCPYYEQSGACGHDDIGDNPLTSHDSEPPDKCPLRKLQGPQW